MCQNDEETIVAIVNLLISIGWNPQQAEEWIHLPNPQWEEKSPADIIAEGNEDMVIRYLKKQGINVHAYL